jgi:hypothetical protein
MSASRESPDFLAVGNSLFFWLFISLRFSSILIQYIKAYNNINHKGFAVSWIAPAGKSEEPEREREIL